MGRSRRGLIPPEWVGQRLTAIGPFLAEPGVEHVTYTFTDLPELATDWCRFVLEVTVPAEPTPAIVDELIERWNWYRPLHATHAGELRDGVVRLYRACDDYLPRELSDAEVVAQAQRGMIQISPRTEGESPLAAELFVAFDGDHGPLFEWDGVVLGWSQIG